ncbi:NUDIX hydrolase [Candidatus Woesebacteria bacterium]|nr:NUDIX hydrolase [Candidatus Woesebacteria bacterium]
MWKILKTSVLFDHPRITLLEDEIELPNGSHTKYLKFQNKGDGSDIIAIRDDGKILLVKEYNHPVEKELWQFPGGFIDNGETHEQAAIRELIEEGGYLADTWETLGYQHIYRRRISEMSWVHIATQLHEVERTIENSEQGMTTHWFGEDEIDAMIANGEITAGDTLAIWAIYKAHKQQK